MVLFCNFYFLCIFVVFVWVVLVFLFFFVLWFVVGVLLVLYFVWDVVVNVIDVCCSGGW